MYYSIWYRKLDSNKHGSLIGVAIKGKRRLREVLVDIHLDKNRPDCDPVTVSEFTSMAAAERDISKWGLAPMGFTEKIAHYGTNIHIAVLKGGASTQPSKKKVRS